jgi:thiol-disulfide isomerase/thioredoxin
MINRNHFTHKITSIFFLIWLFVFYPATSPFAETKLLNTGARFPNLTFKDSVSKETQQYLGLSSKKINSIRDMKGSMIIVEVFSTYCTSCPRNIPVLNSVYSTIEKDPALKGQIKIIGIAVGNNIKEANTYRKEYRVLYPVFTDYDFVNHKALGSPRVPYTIFVKRDVSGKNIVVSTHEGIFEDGGDVIIKIKKYFPCGTAKSK